MAGLRSGLWLVGYGSWSSTPTTIVTFLMVFVIQNTQSRDTQAMQLNWTS